MMELFRSCWLDGTGVEWTDPQVSLLHADLSGLPPIAVYYGEDELLATDGAEFAARAKAAGNEVVVRQSTRVSTPSSWAPAAFRSRPRHLRNGRLAALHPRTRPPSPSQQQQLAQIVNIRVANQLTRCQRLLVSTFTGNGETMPPWKGLRTCRCIFG